MANKQPAVTEQTKTNLRRAFLKLYESKPLSKITVKQITDLAGYNRGTFYLYFKDVYDLLDDIESKMLQIIADMMRGLTTPGDEGAASFASLMGATPDETALASLTKMAPGKTAFASLPGSAQEGAPLACPAEAKTAPNSPKAAHAPELESTMGVLAQAARTYGDYVRVLLSDRGDPVFKARLKDMVWPVVRRAVVRDRVLSKQEEQVIKEFCLAGLVAAISTWLEEADPLPIDAFIRLLADDLLGGSDVLAPAAR